MKEYGEEEGGPCQGISGGLSGNSLNSTAAQYLYLTNLTNTECPGQGISWAEAEKPRRRISIADRKVFAHPESFCA